jgi:hypothetical protein
MPGSQPHCEACMSASSLAADNIKRGLPRHPQEHIARALCRGWHATTTPLPPSEVPMAASSLSGNGFRAAAIALAPLRLAGLVSACGVAHISLRFARIDVKLPTACAGAGRELPLPALISAANRQVLTRSDENVNRTTDALIHGADRQIGC